MVTRDVAKDPAQTAIISAYGEQVKEISGKVLGTVTAPSLPATSAADRETSLGRLIADAQLADTSVVSGGRAPQIAFMNPGGIRAALSSTDGSVSYGQAFTVQPFSNYVVSMDLTGQQVYDLLEQQFSGRNAGGNSKLLQVSKGFTYSYSASAPEGAKVVAGSVLLDGAPIDKAATYRVAANSFLSDGGDSFAAFAAGKNKYIGGLDIDAFAAYLTAASPYTPVETDRITALP